MNPSEGIGIVGAGQLSQMLVQSAARAGFRLHVYAGSSADPAAQEAGALVSVGSISERDRLSRFLSEITICGFESELVDCQALRFAAQGLPVRFVPNLETMERLSEKFEQKRVLRNLGIPTAPFVEGPTVESELDGWFEQLRLKLGEHFVVKWSKFGYDGRGVLLVDDEAGLARAKASCRVALARGVKLYAEAKVSYVRELAIIGCHSTSGDFTAYPLVISEQEHGICRRVRGPAVSLGTSARFETLAVQYAEKVAKALPLFGSFGIELFETHDGDLWVNEIAPRVHNSGHYTQEACAGTGSDQFENHLRALSGGMLGSTAHTPYFAMLNLLGPPGAQGRLGDVSNLPTPPAGVALHWYNKGEIFPGRKLGHLNVVASSPEELSSRMALMEAYEKDWAEMLRHSQSKGT